MVQKINHPAGLTVRQDRQDLDERQREAVCSDAKRILVVAGPGSGKTRVLATRFARLISDGADPSGILAVTFTNRAAGEMRARIHQLTGGGAGREGRIGTFHSFCLDLIKRVNPGMTLYGRAEQTDLLKGLGVKNPSKTIDEISTEKNRSCPTRSTHTATPSSGLLALYQEELRKKNALDLDDLVLEAGRLLEQGEGPILTHIMVDEFQDINPPQAHLVELLAGRGAALLAIGDPDQAIYAFRGASLKTFLDFEQNGAVVIRLEKNYRSGARLVAASNSVINNNSERPPSTPVRSGGTLCQVECADERAEAEFIVREIESAMGGLTSLTVGGGGGDRESGGGGDEARFSDFGVLFRTRRQADALASAFKSSSIPFHVVAPPGPGLADFVKHLKSERPRPGVLLPELIRTVAHEFGLETGLVELLVRTAEACVGEHETIERFTEAVLLLGPADNLDIKADKVTLMTMHASKGLEFPIVFITGVEDGLIPLKAKGRIETEEERRLFYVAMTRTENRLYLLHTTSRRLFGAHPHPPRRSPFLDEIPAELLTFKRVEKKRRVRRAVQKGLFE